MVQTTIKEIQEKLGDFEEILTSTDLRGRSDKYLAYK